MRGPGPVQTFVMEKDKFDLEFAFFDRYANGEDLVGDATEASFSDRQSHPAQDEGAAQAAAFHAHRLLEHPSPAPSLGQQSKLYLPDPYGAVEQQQRPSQQLALGPYPGYRWTEWAQHQHQRQGRQLGRTGRYEHIEQHEFGFADKPSERRLPYYGLPFETQGARGMRGGFPFLTGEFVQADMWASHYHRNNKRGGLKNLRCFPHCTDGTHKTKGFCGAPMKVKLLEHNEEKYANAGKPHFLAWVEIGKAVLKKDDESIRLGQVISQDAAESLERSSKHPFNPWIRGKMISHEPESGSGHPVFEFHHEKRGWHYGFVANKHLAQLRHCVRAYIFVLTNPNDPRSDIRCCSISSSPTFTLTCRRRTAGPTKASESAATVAPAAGNAAKTSTGTTCVGLKRSFESLSPNLASFSADRNPKSRPNPPEDVLASLARVPSVLSTPECNISPDERQKRFFRVVSNLLQVTEESLQLLGPLLDSASGPSDSADSEPTEERNARIGLMKLALYLAKEREYTRTIERILDHGGNGGDDDSINRVVCALYPKIDSFLRKCNTSLYEVSEFKRELLGAADFVPRKSSLGPTLSPMLPQAQNSSTNHSSTVKFERPHSSAEVHTKDSGEHPGPFSKDSEPSSRMDNMAMLFPPAAGRVQARLVASLASFVGTWERNEKVLSGLERFYKKLRIPWLMRECYKVQQNRFTILYDKVGDPETVMVCNGRKLFSSGFHTYCVDGAEHKFTLPSPLPIPQQAVQTYRTSFDSEKSQFVVVHNLDGFRITRFIRLEPGVEEPSTIEIDITLEEQIPDDTATDGGAKWKTIDQIRGGLITRVM